MAVAERPRQRFRVYCRFFFLFKGIVEQVVIRVRDLPIFRELVGKVEILEFPEGFDWFCWSGGCCGLGSWGANVVCR